MIEVHWSLILVLSVGCAFGASVTIAVLHDILVDRKHYRRRDRGIK